MSEKKTGGQVFSNPKSAAANFASEKPKKRRKPADHIDYDVRQAEALGYGCHYGNYKADHPDTKAEYEAATGRVEKVKVAPDRLERACLQCGGKFYATVMQVNKKYCCDDCRQKADQARKVGRGPAIYCARCGGEIPRGSHRTVYCSQDCYYAAQHEREKNRKGGKTNANP